MAQKNEIPILLTALLITLTIIGGIGFILFRSSPDPIQDNFPSVDDANRNLPKLISSGSTILVPGTDNEAKQFAAKAIAEGNNTEAIRLFSNYLWVNPNDPEALIYFNNLQAISHNPLKIAVVVPIGSNLNISQEMLRGSAQAQNEINKRGGINGRYLHITIANDSNQPETAKQIAQALVKNSEILAVVGHNASNASLIAAPIYQNNKLVMVNPTSFANGISDVGDHIFRVVPTVSSSAKSLVQKFSKNNRKIAICYDSQAPDGVSFQQEFVANLLAQGLRQAPTVCDLNDPSLNSQTEIAEAVNSGADSLLILPHIDRLQKAYDLAKANKGKLSLYGNSTLATIKTLEQGKASQGLTLVVPWSSKTIKNMRFAQSARQLWGGDVSWRSAGNYDATYTVATGLKQSQNRQGLQEALESPNFISTTTNGEVKFLPNGDRAGQGIIVQVKPSSSHPTGYDFIPLPP